MSTISYLVRNKYEKTPTGYAVTWELLESLLAKSVVGSLRVEPYGKDGESAILCYANHIEPATKLVAGLKGYAIKEGMNTVDAIAKEAEHRHKKK